MIRKWLKLRRFRRDLYVGQYVLVLRDGVNKVMKVVNLYKKNKSVLVYDPDRRWESHPIKNIYPAPGN